MKRIVFDSKQFCKIDNCVACIGYFDGVHIGHQSLIKVCKDIAKMNDLKSMVICFDPDPNDIIDNKHNKHILSFKDRLTKFANYGLDYCIVIPFDKKLMNTSPEVFINDYLLKMNISTLVCGFDYTFGAFGKGNHNLLAKYMNIVVVAERKYYGKKISSTRIKENILSGNFKIVNKLLGYEYAYKCKAIDVNKIKSNNIVIYKPVNKELVFPMDGVYKEFTVKNGCFIVKNKKQVIKDSSEYIYLK